jgi:hypothetical protein
MYEKWSLGGRRRHLDLTRQLSARYRTAWASGDRDDRAAALGFVFDQRDSHGFDLVVDGLSSDDFSIARSAAAICLSLILEGHDMGPSVRGSLEGFGRRFPDADVFTWAASKALDETEASN